MKYLLALTIVLSACGRQSPPVDPGAFPAIAKPATVSVTTPVVDPTDPTVPVTPVSCTYSTDGSVSINMSNSTYPFNTLVTVFGKVECPHGNPDLLQLLHTPMLQYCRGTTCAITVTDVVSNQVQAHIVPSSSFAPITDVSVAIDAGYYQ